MECPKIFMTLAWLAVLCPAVCAENSDSQPHAHRSVFAQHMRSQSRRINQAVKDGSITSQQASDLKSQEQEILQGHAAAEQNGGHITTEEQQQLSTEERSINRQIYQARQASSYGNMYIRSSTGGSRAQGASANRNSDRSYNQSESNSSKSGQTEAATRKSDMSDAPRNNIRADDNYAVDMSSHPSSMVPITVVIQTSIPVVSPAIASDYANRAVSPVERKAAPEEQAVPENDLYTDNPYE